jgi:hypothetical protein
MSTIERRRTFSSGRNIFAPYLLNLSQGAFQRVRHEQRSLLIYAIWSSTSLKIFPRPPTIIATDREAGIQGTLDGLIREMDMDNAASGAGAGVTPDQRVIGGVVGGLVYAGYAHR